MVIKFSQKTTVSFTSKIQLLIIHSVIIHSKLLFIGYTEALIDMLIHDYEEDQRSLKNSIQDLRESLPAPLATSFEKPCKETAVEEYVSRFAQR